MRVGSPLPRYEACGLAGLNAAIDRWASTAPCGLLVQLFSAWVPDPTGGAKDNLNVPLTLQTHADHRPPAWAADPADPTPPNPAKVTVVIGHHTVLRGVG